MPYYPYVLVQNVWSDQQLYFFSSLASLAQSLYTSDQQSEQQKIYKILLLQL